MCDNLFYLLHKTMQIDIKLFTFGTLQDGRNIFRAASADTSDLIARTKGVLYIFKCTIPFIYRFNYQRNLNRCADTNDNEDNKLSFNSYLSFVFYNGILLL